MRSAFRPLRGQHVFPTVRHAIQGAAWRAPGAFRVLQFSVQFDHLHLIVEATDNRTLSSGLRGLAIRVARSVNALVSRRGPVWADRWFGRELTSPRQVRNALLYVLANFRKHDRRALRPGLDPFSSAAWFDGWRFGAAGPRSDPDDRAQSPPVNAPRTWLARAGWRRHGLLSIDEAPARS